LLRLARKEEAAAVHALLSAAKADIPLVEAFDSDPYRRWVQDCCEKKLVWVSTQGSEILGAAIIEKNKLSYLAVAGDSRRKGIGRQLVQKSKQLAGPNQVTAQAAEENQSARRLLESERFVAVGTKPGAMVRWVQYIWSAAQ
jgi:ribosomal protein S18 acetylase RimI-like enzyme